MSEALLNPQALILGLLVPLIIILLYLRKERNSAVRRRLQLKANGEKAFRWIFPALILTLLWLAYLRPFAGFEEISTKVEGADILAVVDVSNSMYARDVSPNRLEFVKRKLHDLVRIIRERGSGERIGLILFAGKAYLFCPLTQDYSVFLEFVEAIGGEQIAAGGSQIEEALSLASRVFSAVQLLDCEALALPPDILRALPDSR